MLCRLITGEQGQRWDTRSAGNQHTEQQASLMKMPGMADKLKQKQEGLMKESHMLIDVTVMTG